MITVKEGKFFYKLLTEKADNYKEELIKFLSAKGLVETEIGKVKGIDFATAIGSKIDIRHPRFDLNIKVAEEEVVLLFGCQMDSDEFNDLVEGFFG